ncbi:hypothetical protein MMC27_003514 [Xylographa pallens]|nr:hypothetical protein [Xylographa pallens]
MSVFHYTTISFPSPYDDGTDHPQGFILIKFLKSHAVSLLYSPDDQEYYIRKIIRNNIYNPAEPPEIQFSNLATESPFPLLPFLPVAVESACLDDNGVYGLILEAYNGGTQENLVQEFEKRNKPVPESYIWHFIEQTARAYAYLHLGHIDGKKAGDEEWVPIVHRDGAGNNIFLHFPKSSKELGKRPVKPDMFIDAFPRVVLGDLGMANRVTDTEEQSSGGVFDQDGINPWEDIALFGEAVRIMLYTSIENCDIGGDINSFPRLRDANLEDIYSEDLIAALEPFEAPLGPHSWENDNDNAGILPDMRHVAEVLLPQAIQKVQEYKQNGGHVSVRWAQPQPTSLMPYVVSPDDKKGLREIFAVDYRSDWVPAFDAVDFRFNAAGTEVVKLEESDYPKCLQEGYDLTIPELAFDELDSVWATACYADELLKSAVRLAEKNEAESAESDPEQMRDLELMKAARKLLRPVHREDPDAASSSSGSSSSSASNNDDKNGDNDDNNDNSSVAGPSSTDDDPTERDGSRRSKSRLRSSSVKSKVSSPGPAPKNRSRSCSASVKPENMANLTVQNRGRKRKREVSVEYNTRDEKLKGLPRLRETITTTTTRESF